MSIKRVSDLKVVNCDSSNRTVNFSDVLSDCYYGGTELNNSLMEISWNTNPRLKGDKSGTPIDNGGDDNEFESRAITVNALSTLIGDHIVNRSINMYGKKILHDGEELSGVLVVNQSGDLTENGNKVYLRGYDTTLDSTHKTVISSLGDIQLDSNGNLKIQGKDGLTISTDGNASQLLIGNHQNVILSSDTNLSVVQKTGSVIYGSGGLTIYYKSGSSLISMLKFDGQNVYAYGKWHFPNSYPTTGNQKSIDGYIEHAYYS